MSIAPSDEQLNALIDGELTAPEAEALLKEARTDPALRDRLGQLQLGKQLVRQAYAAVPPPSQRQQPRPPIVRWRAAALLLFCAGALLGWLSHAGLARTSTTAATELAAAPESVAARTDRVIVHLGTAAPGAAQATLEHVEGILEAAKASGQSVAVEIVANAGGLDLLREGVSTQGERLARLRAAYPSLALIACGQTAQRLRDSGVEVRLLPGTTVASSALDQIVRRMQQGWAYVRI